MAYVHPVYHGGRNYPEQVTEEFLTCRLCQVPGFKQAKQLLCGHIFCRPCLETHFRSHARPAPPVVHPKYSPCALLPCPACGQVINVPPTGVAGFKDNIFVDTQIDRLLRRHNKERGRDDTRYNIHGYKLDQRFHASFPPN